MFETRSEEREIMDDFSLRGEEIGRTLDSIETVNRLLGGLRVLLGNLRLALDDPELKRLTRPPVLADLGSGSGDGLRAIARWGRDHGRPIQLIGIDASEFVLAHARARSATYPEILFREQDLLGPDLDLTGIDIVTLNLCLHHFTDTQIQAILGVCRRSGVRAVLVNDLHRHWLAFFLFHLFCLIFRSPRLARIDGLTSIRKGFRRTELETIALESGAASYHLRWRWAFRYQLVLFLAGTNADGV